VNLPRQDSRSYGQPYAQSRAAWNFSAIAASRFAVFSMELSRRV
jgi:hypothetical protein